MVSPNKTKVSKRRASNLPRRRVPIKLDIGAGHPGWQREPLDEWTHLGIHPCEHIEIVADFGSIPLDDGACEEIYIGDVIEHVPAWRYDEVLGEWNRVLALGGKVSGTCPNGDRAMKAYAAGKIDFAEAKLSLYGWADRSTEQHYTCFNEETLTKLLRKYGFEVTDYSQSPGPPDRPWWLVFSGTKVREL